MRLGFTAIIIFVVALYVGATATWDGDHIDVSGTGNTLDTVYSDISNDAYISWNGTHYIVNQQIDLTGTLTITNNSIWNVSAADDAYSIYLTGDSSQILVNGCDIRLPIVAGGEVPFIWVAAGVNQPSTNVVSIENSNLTSTNISLIHATDSNISVLVSASKLEYTRPESVVKEGIYWLQDEKAIVLQATEPTDQMTVNITGNTFLKTGFVETGGNGNYYITDNNFTDIPAVAVSLGHYNTGKAVFTHNTLENISWNTCTAATSFGLGGVAVVNTNFNISHNNITHYQGYGIDPIYSYENLSIIGNRLTGRWGTCGGPITVGSSCEFATFSGTLLIQGNLVNQTGYGSRPAAITVQGGHHFTIENNTVEGNVSYAIKTAYNKEISPACTGHNIIRYNQIINNLDGIGIQISQDWGEVYGNEFIGCPKPSNGNPTYRVSAFSDNITIRNNTFTNSQYERVALYYNATLNISFTLKNAAPYNINNPSDTLGLEEDPYYWVDTWNSAETILYYEAYDPSIYDGILLDDIILEGITIAT